MEEKIVKKLDEIFDGLAIPTMESQKRMLGIHGKLSKEDARKMVERIRELFTHLAGEQVAKKVYDELLRMIEEESD